MRYNKDSRLISEAYRMIQEDYANLELVQSKMIQDLDISNNDGLWARNWQPQDAIFGDTEREIIYNLTDDNGQNLLNKYLDIIDIYNLYKKYNTFTYKKDLTNNGKIENITALMKGRISKNNAKSKPMEPQLARDLAAMRTPEEVIDDFIKTGDLFILDNDEPFPKSIHLTTDMSDDEIEEIKEEQLIIAKAMFGNNIKYKLAWAYPANGGILSTIFKKCTIQSGWQSPDIKHIVTYLPEYPNAQI